MKDFTKQAVEIEDIFTGDGNKNFALIHAISDALSLAYQEGRMDAVDKCCEEFDENLEIRSNPDYRQIMLKVFLQLKG